MQTSPEEPITGDNVIATINRESELLTAELEEIEKNRSYYDGDQTINFASEEWIRAFGTQFQDWRSNWCEVVIDAIEERLELDAILFRDPTKPDAPKLEDRSSAVWRTLHRNEFEEMENDLYNNTLVEASGYVIVWPDEETDVRVDANSAMNVRVTYDPDDTRRIKHAIKRWVTDEGETRLTFYTPEFLYKYKIPSRQPLPLGNNPVPLQDVGWVPRTPEETGDPMWPLPNPFGEVPIVEFPARRYKSELHNVIPIQDAINKTSADMLVTGEYASYKQKYIVSSSEAPDGGWKSSPGYVWEIPPETDIDGRPLPTQVGSFDESDPQTFIAILEFLLGEVAMISKTPTYYFLQTSKAGSRGDAPSGEALRVTETGLSKKVSKYQETFGARWLRVGRLIDMVLQNFNDPVAAYGDLNWKSSEAHFLLSLLEEGRRMIQELYLPPEMAWRHVGLTEEQISEATEWLENNEPYGQVFTTERVESQSKEPVEGGEAERIQAQTPA